MSDRLFAIKESLDGQEIGSVGYDTLKDLINLVGQGIYARLEYYRDSISEQNNSELNVYTKVQGSNQRKYEVCIDYDVFCNEISDISEFIEQLEEWEEEASGMKIVFE